MRLNAIFVFVYISVHIAESRNTDFIGQRSRQQRQNSDDKKTWNSSNDNKMSLEDLRELSGFKMSNSPNMTRSPTMSALPGTKSMACNNPGCLPPTFSWLEKKHECPSIGQIRKQRCGDCWAVSSASVLSDRHCLVTKEQRIFSAKDISSCAEGNKCHNGDPKQAMDYYVKHGVVTGGDPAIHEQPNGCQPYVVDKHAPIQCQKQCDNKIYNIQFDQDRRKGVSGYVLSAQSVTEIKLDLLMYGPLVATFVVFEDFANYTSGIYQHYAGIAIGRHSVRLIGWGVENRLEYWLLANSMGEHWGENGFFRMRMGQNECEIEGYLIGVDTKEDHGKERINNAKSLSTNNQKITTLNPHPNPPIELGRFHQSNSDPVSQQISTTGTYTNLEQLSSTQNLQTTPDSETTEYFTVLTVLCEVKSSAVSFAFIGTNLGVLKGNSNTVCRNSAAGVVDGSNNIICENSGKVLGNTNMFCSDTLIDGFLKCDTNGRKMCENCEADSRLHTPCV